MLQFGRVVDSKWLVGNELWLEVEKLGAEFFKGLRGKMMMRLGLSWGSRVSVKDFGNGNGIDLQADENDEIIVASLYPYSFGSARRITEQTQRARGPTG